MKRVLIACVAIVLVFALVACGGGDELIGTWVSVSGHTWEFKEDGTLVMGEAEARYKMSGNQVQIGSGEGEDFKVIGTLTLNGNQLENEEGVLATKK